MCGRFVITLTWQELVELSRSTTTLGTPIDLPQFNIAPMQRIPVLRQSEGMRSLSALRWGFVPLWAKEDFAAKMINARSETVREKPSFRDAFRTGRCIIPASGFYEWRREGRARKPHYFQRNDSLPMLFAGLWSRNDSLKLETCSILTTQAGRDVSPVHHRMPVILNAGDIDLWLSGSPDETAVLMRPTDDGVLSCHQVAAAVNNAAAQGPQLIEPARPEPETGLLF